MSGLQTSQLSCKLNSACDCVHVLCSMVEVMGHRSGLNEKQTNRMVLAADELFANIGKHGYRGEEGLIEMRAKCTAERLSFEFRDYAPPVLNEDILCGRALDESEVCPGGLGFYLIRAVMDEVRHQALSNGNRWLLVKHMNREQFCEA